MTGQNSVHMQLAIHRLAHDIGGPCVEVSTPNTRILLDFGMPLAGPDIKGLYRGEEKNIDAILLSHFRFDHYGLLSHAHPDIPVYMSRGAKELVEISDLFAPDRTGVINCKVIGNKKHFKIGDITVTPYPVDHSAFDARAFLLETGGKRVFYSGDFRAHSRKSVLFRRMLKDPPKDIDCLIMDASMRDKGGQPYEDEAAVEAKIKEILRGARNITFLFASPRNIDRLVSAYRACIRTGKIFVIDIYTAYMFDRLRKVSDNIPQFNRRNVRVKFFKDQADTLAKTVSTQILYHYNTKKIDIFEINRKKDRILMLAGDGSMFPDIVKSLDSPMGGKIIYSMWEGYLTEKLRDHAKKKDLEIVKVHTSGHAALEDLKAFAEAVNPGVLVPIHAPEDAGLPGRFGSIRVSPDSAFCL